MTTMMRHHVANFRGYEGAQRAVDALSDNDFPIEELTIVGHGVRVVESVTGRRTLLTAVASGAGSGVVAGALVGWFLGLFSWIAPLVTGAVLALYGALFGAVIGAVIALVAQAAVGRKHAYSSIRSMEAQSYEVVAGDLEVANQARSELLRLDALEELQAGPRP